MINLLINIKYLFTRKDKKKSELMSRYADKIIANQIQLTNKPKKCNTWQK